MPYIENSGAKIYWEEAGKGEPLVLIMGLASSIDMWHRTRPLMAEHFRTLVIENRGVGRSSVPPPPYSIAAMAADVKAVMDAANIEQARVFGISMGGMIAQEFALSYPERVRALILGCTNFGGKSVKTAAPKVLEILKARGSMTPKDGAYAMVPFIYDAGTPREKVEEDLQIRMQWFPTEAGYYGQLGAILSWESRQRLSQITAPTLVIHGESDALVPPENGRLIAALIPQAKLLMLKNASHIFMTDQTEISHREMLNFFKEH
ncbi:MAG: alpha/beta fold hydrolase [Acidobacteria bacterium]|nr:alpha/beta fold hydrolase [Acidobacteriota bacterium]